MGSGKCRRDARRTRRLGRSGHLAARRCTGHHDGVNDAQAINREEVLVMMGALADIHVAVHRILGSIEGEDDGEEEEEEDLPDV